MSQTSRASSRLAFTIVASNYVPMAHVLGSSFLTQHPDARFVVIVVDSHETSILPDDAIERWGVDRLRGFIDEFWVLATLYDVTEFATSLKPYVARHLLSEADVVLYIDPDIVVYDDLSALFDATADRGISLTPHCLEPMARDLNTPSEHDIMQSGIYNLGYVGVAQGGLPFLDWWAERLARDAIIDPSNQLFTDQRWIDLAVPIFNPYIERSPAYNVAYWNVDQRPMEIVGNRVEVMGEPLKFFHFSGFDPKTPWWLSKHHPLTPRNLVSDSPALTFLCEDYAERLNAARETLPVASPYRWNEPIPGLVLTREVRRLFRDELIKADRGECPAPPNPYEHGAAAFLTWLSSTPESGGLPRYAQVILASRADLQHAFAAEVQRGEVAGFLAWINNRGVGDFPWLALLDRTAASQVSVGEGVPLPSGRVDDFGIDVVGYLRSEHGVGEAGRLATEALRSAGVPVSTIVSSRTVSRQNIEIDLDCQRHHKVKLLAVNADATAQIADDLGDEFLRDSYVIGQWFWELEDFPDTYGEAFHIVDEVWVATEFVADAVRRRAPAGVRVEVMPLPLVAPEVDSAFSRSSLGLDDRYMFLFSFDFMSVSSRKNPLGLLDAYMSAFGEAAGAQLVIKSINGDRNLKALEEIRWAARFRRDITIIDGYLDRATAAALTASADCYVSLHRSEGLGLTMSEAMSLGVPVIATGYSGNLDFMNDDVAVLIPWTYEAVGEGSDPYPPDSRWACPDTRAAAQAMRRLFEDPAERRRIGQAGRQHLAEQYSLGECGARMRRRLEIIEQERRHA